MTTCVFSRPTRTIAADTQNTDGSNSKWRVHKIEHLSWGVFLGSGHCRTIALARQWAVAKFNPNAEPEWDYYLDDPEDRDFQCVVIEYDTLNVWMIDGELLPQLVYDDHIAIGSGAAYALGALDAGADPVAAVEIAALRDPGTSGPIHTYIFEE